MNKDLSPNNNALSRQEMVERHRRQDYQDTKGEFNEFSRRAMAGLQYHPEEEMLETALNRLDRRITATANPNFTIRRMLSIAAAAALLLAAGYFLFLQPSDTEALLAQHFNYLPSAVNLESGDRNATPSVYDQGLNNRSLAMQAYEAGNYPQASSLMEKHLAENDRDAEIKLYLGIILLGEGLPEAAIGYLEAAQANLPQPAYERPTRWYLALALLRNGHNEQARKLFLELEDGNDRYARNARALLKQL